MPPRSAAGKLAATLWATPVTDRISRPFARARWAVANGRKTAAAQRAVMTAPTAGWDGIALSGLGQAQYLQGRASEAVATLRQAVGQIPDANPIVRALGVANLGLAEASLGVPSRSDRPAPRRAGRGRRGPVTGQGSHAPGLR